MTGPKTKKTTDAERRQGVMAFREQFNQRPVENAGVCVFTQRPCIGGVCEQYDPLGEQCGIRSIGIAASAFMEAYAVIPMEEEDGPDEQVLASAAEMGVDADRGGASGISGSTDVATVGEQPDDSAGLQEPGHSPTNGDGESG